MGKSIDDIDFAPLHMEVTEADVEAYKQQYPGQKLSRSSVIALWGGAVVFAGYFGASFYEGLKPVSPVLGAVVGFGFFALIITIAVFIARGAGGNGWHAEVRTYLFASRNGGTYTPHSQYLDSQTGMIFDQGDGRTLRDIIQLQIGDQPVEIGNHTYTTGSGKTERRHEYGYMRLTLPRHVPHMVLDSQDNNTKVFGITLSTGLSDIIRGDQVLKLEGDFNNYFTLYCPKEYERDALYIFAPDLMALMIDETALYDVEIVDGDMYIYQNSFFPVNDEAVYRRLFEIAEMVGKKMHKQTVRYVDEKVVDRTLDVVAEPGKRLRTWNSVIAKIVVVIIILSIIWIGVSGVLQTIGAGQ